MAHPLFSKHQATLDQALATIEGRGYWSPFVEMPSPKAYGETANDAGKAAFEALIGKPFPLDQPNDGTSVGHEVSPFGPDLNIRYPHSDPDALVAAAQKAMRGWREAGPQTWVGVSLEILTRLNQRSFEMAYAIMHTTGQAFMMAFQAGGPHAQDRGLEAVAYAGSRCAWYPAARCGRSRRARIRRCAWRSTSPSSRAASRYCSAAAPSPPGTVIPASSPVWPPAIRSSSSPTRRRYCRWR